VDPFSFAGGSGGGGDGNLWGSGRGGDGGGGVIAIFADGKVTVKGVLSASAPGRYFLGSSSTRGALEGGQGAGGTILIRSLKGISTTSSCFILAEGKTAYLATPFTHRTQAMRGASVGHIRMDAMDGPLDLKGTIHPQPVSYRFPIQRVPAAPTQGTYFRVDITGLPGDLAAIYWSWGLKRIAVPPFGILELDLGTGFILAGGLAIPTTGRVPIGSTNFFTHPNKALIGRKIHIQSLTLGLPLQKPRLTNHSSTVIK